MAGCVKPYQERTGEVLVRHPNGGTGIYYAEPEEGRSLLFLGAHGQPDGESMMRQKQKRGAAGGRTAGLGTGEDNGHMADSSGAPETEHSRRERAAIMAAVDKSRAEAKCLCSG